MTFTFGIRQCTSSVIQVGHDVSLGHTKGVTALLISYEDKVQPEVSKKNITGKLTDTAIHGVCHTHKNKR